MIERALSALPWIAAAIALFFGAAWRDCVLVAASAWLCIHAFYARMDAGAPWDGWRAALRCWLAGASMLLGAVALLFMVAGVSLQWWSRDAGHLDAGLSVLLLAATLASLGRLGRRVMAPSDGGVGVGVLAVGTAAATMLLAGNGMTYAPCIFAGASAVAMASIGWRLARHEASALVASDERW